MSDDSKSPDASPKKPAPNGLLRQRSDDAANTAIRLGAALQATANKSTQQVHHIPLIPGLQQT